MSAPPTPAGLRRWTQASLARTAVAIAFDLGTIVFAAAVAQRIGGIAAYLVAVVVIGARQHALLVLTHEAAHLGLAKSRRVNDAIGDVIARLFLFDFATYRRSHLGHHKYLNTSQDPDWARYNAPDSREVSEYRFPMRRSRLAALLLGDLLGLRTLQLFAKVRHYNTHDAGEPKMRRSKTRIALFYVSLAALVAVIGWKAFLLYWVIPIFTWLKMNLRLRLIAEHYAVAGRDGTRNVTLTVSSVSFCGHTIRPTTGTTTSTRQ